jgi:hypothetical protein
MDPIQQLKERLSKHPELKFKATSNTVVVDAPSGTGFSVSFHVAGGEYVVHFDGWHECFGSVDDALNCFISHTAVYAGSWSRIADGSRSSGS